MADVYEVRLTERWTFLNAQNNPVDGYRVTFRVKETGAIDHVIVPEEEFTAEAVDTAIREKIERHRGIAAL